MKKYVAEAIGTFTLVFFGCATVIFMKDEVGLLGVALAFGLTVVAMAYSIGHVSGAHLNPAVSTGAFFAGRLSTKDYMGYVVAQVFGGIIAALVLLVIVQGKTGGYDVATEGLAATGWSEYSMTSALAFEVIATAMFVLVILGATPLYSRAPGAEAPAPTRRCRLLGSSMARSVVPPKRCRDLSVGNRRRRSPGFGPVQGVVIVASVT